MISRKVMVGDSRPGVVNPKVGTYTGRRSPGRPGRHDGRWTTSNDGLRRTVYGVVRSDLWKSVSVTRFRSDSITVWYFVVLLTTINARSSWLGYFNDYK